jgi:hypothetical protein
MPLNSENKAADSIEPPEIYIPACGVLCDIFWWARPNPPDASRPPMIPPSSSGKPETP